MDLPQVKLAFQTGEDQVESLWPTLAGLCFQQILKSIHFLSNISI